nr:MAG TPA: hypothetical protein [Caudoviricetes sp.]
MDPITKQKRIQFFVTFGRERVHRRAAVWN